MMSEMVVIATEAREKLGTGSARSLRRTGMIPVAVYGNDGKTIAVAVQEKEVTKLYRKHGFTSTVIGLNIDGKVHKVLPKAIQLHPVTDIVSHADFVYLAKSTQKVDVPIVFEGKERALGVKRGGFFNIIFRKITLSCPVDSIPQHIIIDVTNMGIGSSIVASKLALPSGCSLATKSNLVIASITGRGGKSDEAAEGGEQQASQE
jgi:large subunit ribosomal protein L25